MWGAVRCRCVGSLSITFVPYISIRPHALVVVRGALLIFLLERIYHEERSTMTKLNLIMQGREHD